MTSTLVSKVNNPAFAVNRLQQELHQIKFEMICPFLMVSVFGKYIYIFGKNIFGHIVLS